jgi:tyrosyl-tRNA synthetase
MDIARKNNLKRVLRCTQIMGRSENDDLSAAQIFYPIMQAADIFFLKVRRVYAVHAVHAVQSVLCIRGWVGGWVRR